MEIVGVQISLRKKIPLEIKMKFLLRKNSKKIENTYWFLVLTIGSSNLRIYLI